MRCGEGEEEQEGGRRVRGRKRGEKGAKVNKGKEVVCTEEGQAQELSHRESTNDKFNTPTFLICSEYNHKNKVQGKMKPPTACPNQ